MPVGEQADQKAVQHILLPYNHASYFLAQSVYELSLDLNRFIQYPDVFRRVHGSKKLGCKIRRVIERKSEIWIIGKL